MENILFTTLFVLIISVIFNILQFALARNAEHLHALEMKENVIIFGKVWGLLEQCLKVEGLEDETKKRINYMIGIIENVLTSLSIRLRI